MIVQDLLKMRKREREYAVLRVKKRIDRKGGAWSTKHTPVDYYNSSLNPNMDRDPTDRCGTVPENRTSSVFAFSVERFLQSRECRGYRHLCTERNQ